ncbi:MAG: hypothetical protein WDZ69_02225 [Candidatus Pacearchaeota archaeon]
MPNKKTAAISILLLSLAIYILFPTPDELFIYPSLGLIISNLFSTSVLQGQLISATIYRGIGIIVLIMAIFVGGRPIYKKFRSKI